MNVGKNLARRSAKEIKRSSECERILCFACVRRRESRCFGSLLLFASLSVSRYHGTVRASPLHQRSCNCCVVLSLPRTEPGRWFLFPFFFLPRCRFLALRMEASPRRLAALASPGDAEEVEALSRASPLALPTRRILSGLEAEPGVAGVRTTHAGLAEPVGLKPLSDKSSAWPGS